MSAKTLSNPAGWANYTPAAIIDKTHRHPANAEWGPAILMWIGEDELFKKVAISYNTKASTYPGGTKVVNYFAAVDFVNEGDLFKSFENGRGYNSGFGYNRINVRSNLDFPFDKNDQILYQPVWFECTTSAALGYERQ